MLNKRECRKFFHQYPKLNPRSGIMNASQVDFIVRAAVKVIDRHKTLVLWLYSRDQASQGDVRPCMAVFQDRDDFLTLAHRDDGSTVWRSASFSRLNSSWDFSSRFCGYTDNCLDESQHRTHRILGIAAEDVDFLRGHDPDMTLLKIYQGYTGLKKRRELLTWQIRNDASNDVLPILQHMTPHKAMRYLDAQFGFLRFRKTKYGGQRYKTMQDLVTEYRDYLDICKKLEYDLKNSFVKYPKDLQKAHDKAAKRLKHKIDAKVKRDFAAVYKNISGQYDFEISGMKIVYPKISDDIIREGHARHHCVGSYTGHIIRGECVVLFLRQCCDLEKSFYTIEIRGNKLVQVRGMGNCVATPDVEKFIKSWKQRVLDRIEIAA